MSSSIDLVASDAIYHGQCESIFLRKNLYLRQRGQKRNLLTGRPTDNGMKSNFEKLCKWFDEKTKLFIMSELHTKKNLFAEKDLNVYCLKWMKK